MKKEEISFWLLFASVMSAGLAVGGVLKWFVKQPTTIFSAISNIITCGNYSFEDLAHVFYGAVCSQLYCCNIQNPGANGGIINLNGTTYDASHLCSINPGSLPQVTSQAFPGENVFDTFVPLADRLFGKSFPLEIPGITNNNFIREKILIIGLIAFMLIPTTVLITQCFGVPKIPRVFSNLRKRIRTCNDDGATANHTLLPGQANPS